MNVVLFGASGMVGAGALLECLDAPGVTSVLVVGRRSCGVAHPKLTERLLEDLFDLSSIQADLAGRDACFWCLGVTSVGQTEASYQRTTYEITMVAARALHAASPGLTFMFVSGAGTDSASRVMWARIKGKAEDGVFAAGFRAAYAFRPGFIQPMRGVRSRTGMYQAFYSVFRPLTPLLVRLAPGLATTTVSIGRAMLHVAAHGWSKRILESRDINAAAAAARTHP